MRIDEKDGEEKEVYSWEHTGVLMIAFAFDQRSVLEDVEKKEYNK